MKLSPEPEDRLSGALREWVVDAPVPARFQEHVWNRIATAEAKVRPSFGASIRAWVTQALRQPRVAYSYAAVLLALGMAAGGVTAHVQSNRLQTDLGHRYVQSVDPYQHTLASR